jgi:hypothetical protein
MILLDMVLRVASLQTRGTLCKHHPMYLDFADLISLNLIPGFMNLGAHVSNDLGFFLCASEVCWARGDCRLGMFSSELRSETVPDVHFPNVAETFPTYATTEQFILPLFLLKEGH